MKRWSCDMRHSVLWWQPISGTLGNIMQNPFFITGQKSMKQWYVAIPKKVTRISFVVVCYILTVCDLPTCSTCTSSLFCANDIWLVCRKSGKLPTGLAVVVLYARLQDLIIQVLCSATTRCSPQMDRSTDPKFQDQCLVGSSLTTVFRRLDKKKPILMS